MSPSDFRRVTDHEGDELPYFELRIRHVWFLRAEQMKYGRPSPASSWASGFGLLLILALMG